MGIKSGTSTVRIDFDLMEIPAGFPFNCSSSSYSIKCVAVCIYDLPIFMLISLKRCVKVFQCLFRIWFHCDTLCCRGWVDVMCVLRYIIICFDNVLPFEFGSSSAHTGECLFARCVDGGWKESRAAVERLVIFFVTRAFLMLIII